MNIEDIREYCLSLNGVAESFPFDETTLVFKVGGKMFLLTDLEADLAITIKCDPEEAIFYRARYSTVSPAYHMNKRYWNTVRIDGSVSDEILCEWIRKSYALVFNNLSGKLKLEIQNIK